MIPFAYRTITVSGLPFQGCSAREILNFVSLVILQDNVNLLATPF